MEIKIKIIGSLLLLIIGATTFITYELSFKHKNCLEVNKINKDYLAVSVILDVDSSNCVFIKSDSFKIKKTINKNNK